MARFLFCPVPEAGDVFPTVPVALELRAAGHQVAYLTSPDFEPILRLEGFQCVVTAGGVWGSEAPSSPESLAEQLVRLPDQLDVLSRAVAEVRAEVLVDGAFPFAPRLLAEQRGMPHATVQSGSFPIPTNDALFPHGPGRAPPTDDTGRTLARLAHVLQTEQEEPEVRAWNDARASLGLAPSRTHPWRSEASPQLVLLPTSPALEYPRTDLPEQFWFVGPLVWQMPAPMPPRVAALTGRPLVYVSQGATYNRNPVLIRLALEALRDQAVNVVVTMVREWSEGELGPLPANVVVERFVPFSELAPRLSLAITHGGAGTVHTALSHGVPLVVLPFTADQHEVAARCAWTGAGLRLDPFTSSPAELLAAVKAILGNPGHRNQARRIMHSFAALEGPPLATSLLDRLARTGQPVRRQPCDNPWPVSLEERRNP
jgi:MGT family glycosyltransferase